MPHSVRGPFDPAGKTHFIARMSCEIPSPIMEGMIKDY